MQPQHPPLPWLPRATPGVTGHTGATPGATLPAQHGTLPLLLRYTLPAEDPSQALQVPKAQHILPPMPYLGLTHSGEKKVNFFSAVNPAWG